MSRPNIAAPGEALFLIFRDGCNNQIDGLKAGIYPVKKLLVYCLQPDSGLAVSIILF